MSFPSREYLMSLDITKLRDVAVESPEEEKILQEIVNLKTVNAPLPEKVYNLDAQEAVITTPEEEAKWQKILDERAAKIKAKWSGEEAVLTQNIDKLEEEKAKIEEELKSDAIPTDSGVKCELCGSRGFRHKKGCPTLTE